MTPDLLLTHGYFFFDDPKEVQIRKPYVPLGILYICSYLRAKGFAVDVFDATFSSKQELIRHLQTEPPSVLGIYTTLGTRRNVVEILRAAREAGWRTVVGGPEPVAYAQEYLGAGAEVLVFGEGEATMAELLPALRSNSTSALYQVRGIAFLGSEGQLHTTAPRPQLADLDAQPWPARESVDLPRYVRTWREAHGKGSLAFITARGCPYHCQWCSRQVYGQTHRRRSPRAVVDEVEWLLGRYEPDMVWVADDVFTIHHGWLRKYAAEMRNRGLRVPFECISRADRLNDEAVDLLAELGCFRVWIGSESGSQRILDAMQRGVRVEQVQSAVASCQARGIQAGMFLMWGYQGEDLPDIEATIEHVKQSDPDVFLTTVCYPIKGTSYYNNIASSLSSPRPWGESSDRELTIRGRHTRRFYDFADRLLRDEVQLARLRRSGSDGHSEKELQARIQELRDGLYASSEEAEA
ncbi:MAG TPA: radical SAM protein [Candidatus Acidoferrales bacterium]|nr:radical SAM protein [Candidatus Acidoferrales bacterium]